MPSESNLWRLVRDRLPKIHWQRIETGSTARGVPDLNGCFEGQEFWVELKAIRGNRLGLTPMQISWLTQRTMHGGKCFVLGRKDRTIRLFRVGSLSEIKGLKWTSPYTIELVPPFTWELLHEALIG